MGCQADRELQLSAANLWFQTAPFNEMVSVFSLIELNQEQTLQI